MSLLYFALCTTAMIRAFHEKIPQVLGFLRRYIAVRVALTDVLQDLFHPRTIERKLIAEFTSVGEHF